MWHILCTWGYIAIPTSIHVKSSYKLPATTKLFGKFPHLSSYCNSQNYIRNLTEFHSVLPLLILRNTISQGKVMALQGLKKLVVQLSHCHSVFGQSKINMLSIHNTLIYLTNKFNLSLKRLLEILTIFEIKNNCS